MTARHAEIYPERRTDDEECDTQRHNFQAS